MQMNMLKQLSCNAPDVQSPFNKSATHLLTRLLFDDSGDRMSPTHGKANGKRYRYYVSSRTRIPEEVKADIWRIPAREIEGIVLSFAKHLLNDERKISEWIGSRQSSGRIQTAISTVKKMAEGVSSDAPVHRQRSLLGSMFRSITLHGTLIRFELMPASIAAMLTGETTDADVYEQPR